MAHLEYSNVTHEACLVLNQEEAKKLLPFVKRCLKAESKKLEKYRDIHESGEATERQEDLLMKHEDNVIHLESIIQQIQLLLKP